MLFFIFTHILQNILGGMLSHLTAISKLRSLSRISCPLNQHIRGESIHHQLWLEHMEIKLYKAKCVTNYKA